MPFHSIDEIWQFKKVSFAGDFEFVRREKPHPAYSTIVQAASEQDLSPRFSKSESSRSNNSNNSQGQGDIFSNYMGSEMAHLLPHSPTCAASWAIVAAGAVAGVDFETTGRDSETAKTMLQQLVLGKTGEDKKATGLRYSTRNLIPLPYGHGRFFDDRPILLLVPILALEQVKNWERGTEYWIMCIVGNDEKNTAQSWSSSIFCFDSPREAETQALCTEDDMLMATELLTCFVKANADVLMGRGADGELLTPIDLFNCNKMNSEIEDKIECLEATKRQLQQANKVKVPKLKGRKRPRVLKVKLSGDSIPDPALVACKGAVTWSDRCFEKLLPACNEQPALDPEESLLYEMAREEDEYLYAQSIRPPESRLELAAALGQPVVTPEKDSQSANNQT